jgi:hypothetical protein
MKKKKNDGFIDTGKAESEEFEPDQEVKAEFNEAARLGSGRNELIERLTEHHSKSPELSGGDIDAAWEDSDVGEESVGGANPTPDQNIVEKLGKAVGIDYQDNETLGSEDKLKKRDSHRWELDPASSEDYQERNQPSKR